MNTNLVTRLVCENCGHIFEPGEVGYFIEGEEEFWNSDKITYEAKDTFHPCCCPKCQSEIKTIQVPDNAFKRLVSHSALERASAIDNMDSAIYVSIEESRMRFERHKRRKEQRPEPIQLPIAIVVEFDGYFSFRLFLDMFCINESLTGSCKGNSSYRDDETSLTLKDIRKMATDKNGSMRYCVPESTASDEFLDAHSEKWVKSDLEEYCGYFNMKMKDMIFNVITISPIKGDPKYKVLFHPFYIKQKEN